MIQTWTELITEIISKANRPLRRREILKTIEDMGLEISDQTVAVTLHNGVKSGVLGYVKLVQNKPGYYCNPNWLDEEGCLKVEYKYDPMWDKKEIA